MARIDDTPRRRSVPAVDLAIAELAAGQHGVVALSQLVALGLSARAVQNRVTAGRFHRLHRGVFAVGHTAVTADGRRLAAVLACGRRAVLSHRSAGAAWGLCADDSRRWHVTIPRCGNAGPPTVALHVTRVLTGADVGLVRAIPSTSVARTLVDLAGVLDRHRLERAVHEAEVLRLLDVSGVVAACGRCRGRRGVGVLRALLAEPTAGLTRSALEERFLALCRQAALPLPTLNAAVEVDDRLIEADGLWRHAGVVVELDGAAVHGTRRAFEADRRRDAALAAEGYVVVRLTWRRVTTEPRRVAAELRRVLAVRGGTDTN